jgi:hypothetical protein
MLKQYKVLLVLTLCMSYTAMYGIRKKANCTQMMFYWVKQYLTEFVKVAKNQVISVNRYTKEVRYYFNSKKVTIYDFSGEILDLPNGPSNFHAYLLKGAPNNFYEVSDDNRDDHPLYSFLMDNGVLNAKNAPGSLPKTIM